jgi:hypothetical protein
MTDDSDLFRTREQLERDGWHLDGNVFAHDGKRMLPPVVEDGVPLRLSVELLLRHRQR